MNICSKEPPFITSETAVLAKFEVVVEVDPVDVVVEVDPVDVVPDITSFPSKKLVISDTIFVLFAMSVFVSESSNDKYETIF